MTGRQAAAADFEALLDVFCDGELSAEQHQRLQSMICENASARRHYVEALSLIAQLEWEGGVSAKAEGVADLNSDSFSAIHAPAIVISTTLATSSAARPRKLFDRIAPQIEPDSHLLRFAAVVAFIVLGSWAFFIEFVSSPAYHRDDVAVVEPERPEEPEPKVRFIARLVQTSGAVWIGSERWRTIDSFEEGETLELKEGLAELHYDSGVQVILQGPCKYTIAGPKGGRLDRGKLTARVLTEGNGFNVQTPTALVIDLGTEFAVWVDADGNTNTDVIVGSVKVLPTSRRGSQKRFMVLRAGEAARVSDGGRQLERIAATGRYVRQLPQHYVPNPEPPPVPEGMRSIAIVNHSFEHDRVADGQLATGSNENGNVAEWRTPFGWQWTQDVPLWGGLANPSSSGIPYSDTVAAGSNGAMDGSQIIFFGSGVMTGQGMQQQLQDLLISGATYELRVAAGTRRRLRTVNGEIRLLAGEQVLATTILPADGPDQFREYSLSYKFDLAHQAAVGTPLRIELLMGPESGGNVDYDNVRLYVAEPEEKQAEKPVAERQIQEEKGDRH